MSLNRVNIFIIALTIAAYLCLFQIPSPMSWWVVGLVVCIAAMFFLLGLMIGSGRIR